MMKFIAGIGLALGGLLALTLSAQEAAATKEAPAIVVGTFDSRAVAATYRRSEAFRDVLREKRAEHEKAKEAGDEERIAELEAWGESGQHTAHLQVFGSAPIDDVLALIEHALPDVTAEAGADVLVSKWRLAYVGPKAQFVDVTDAMVALFDPDEETLELVEKIKVTPPVPAEELQRHDH